MKFIQVIQFKTSRSDDVMQVLNDFLDSHKGELIACTGYSCKDRDKEGSYMNVVVFNSYEDAMRNNELPAVQELSEQMMKLCDGPPTFYNLDVLREDQFD
jgi:quinol monooxygenase YgiN